MLKCMEMGKENITQNVYFEWKPLYTGKRNIIRKVSLECFFQDVRHQNGKKHGNLPILEYKSTLPTTCLLSVFKLLQYQNVKTHSEHPLWTRRKTLPKPWILYVFNFLTRKTQKCMESTLIVKRKDITKNVYNNRLWAS